MLEVDDDVLPYVAKQLNYSSVKSLENDVETVRKWLKTQPHLPEVMEAKKVQNFLIMNKGSIEVTKKKIDNYYTVRNLLPDVFDEINPKLPHMKIVQDTFDFFFLPKLTKEKYRVFFIKITNPELVGLFEPVYITRCLFNSQEIRLMEDVAFGDVFICDGELTSLGFVRKITPTQVYNTVVLLYENVFSARLKAVYFVNFPAFGETLLRILKMFLKPKLLNRIHILKSYEELLERVGKEVVPREYGGLEKSLSELKVTVLETFKKYQKHFDRLDTLRVDESLRPEKLRDDEMLGYHGNFKKLEID